jgi:hypothetical protein
VWQFASCRGQSSTQGTSVQMQCSHGASHGGHHLELVTAVTPRNRQKYDLVSHVFVDAESLEFETCQNSEFSEFCTVVLRRSAGNIGARRLLTSTRGLLTSTGTGSCTCFSWVAARTHMYYSSAVRVAGPGDDSSRCLRVQAMHADLACRAAALGVEEVDRGLKCGL